MTPPKLVEYFSFQKREAATPDDLGNDLTTWVEQFQARAATTWLRGGEDVMAARLSGVQPAIVVVRANIQTGLINSFWRCIDLRTNEVFNVMTVEPWGNRQYIDLMVKSGVADG